MALLTPCSAYSATRRFLVLAEDQADGGLIGRVAQPVIHDVAVEVHLAGVLGLEGAFLEVDHDEAAEAEMIEEQVEVEIIVADIEAVLPADEGEALAEFEQEFLEVGEQAGFQFALMEGLFEREEVEDVGVFEGLARPGRTAAAGAWRSKLVIAWPWR